MDEAAKKFMTEVELNQLRSVNALQNDIIHKQQKVIEDLETKLDVVKLQDKLIERQSILIERLRKRVLDLDPWIQP